MSNNLNYNIKVCQHCGRRCSQPRRAGEQAEYNESLEHAFDED